MFEKRLGFLSRGESGLLDAAVSNLDISIEASRHVLNLVNFLKTHDYKKALLESEIIGELETKADGAHQRLVESICTGSFFGGIREDFLTLVEEIDNIADAAKDSSRIFGQRHIPLDTLDYLFRKDVAAFIEECIDTTEVFKQAIVALGKNKAEVLELANEVEKCEEKADSTRGSILENLLKNDVSADPLDIMLLKDFLNIADDIADYSEDGSDVLLILIAKGYT
ncbi:MAG: DUF47 domain-containing protein [Nitrososphaerales archaeon]